MEINAVQCHDCGDIVVSKHRHDWVQCSCENVFTDGGFDYQRIGYMSDRFTAITTLAEYQQALNTTNVLEDTL